MGTSRARWERTRRQPDAGERVFAHISSARRRIRQARTTGRVPNAFRLPRVVCTFPSERTPAPAPPPTTISSDEHDRGLTIDQTRKRKTLRIPCRMRRRACAATVRTSARRAEDARTRARSHRRRMHHAHATQRHGIVQRLRALDAHPPLATHTATRHCTPRIHGETRSTQSVRRALCGSCTHQHVYIARERIAVSASQDAAVGAYAHASAARITEARGERTATTESRRGMCMRIPLDGIDGTAPGRRTAVPVGQRAMYTASPHPSHTHADEIWNARAGRAVVRHRTCGDGHCSDGAGAGTMHSVCASSRALSRSSSMSRPPARYTLYALCVRVWCYGGANRVTDMRSASASTSAPRRRMERCQTRAQR